MKLGRRAHRVRVAGFRFAGVRAGLKTRGPDVALIVADPPGDGGRRVHDEPGAGGAGPGDPPAARRAGVRRPCSSMPATRTRAPGVRGCASSRRRRRASAALLGVPAEQVLACATGRIGVPVPRERLLAGVDAAVAALAPGGFADAAHAIMTTDAFPKTAVRRVRVGGRTVTIAVLGKGCGMIAPDMATLLVFALTDARIGRTAADRALRAAVADSFNAITVDGDMSTNDTVLLLASGAAGNAAVRGGIARSRALHPGADLGADRDRAPLRPRRRGHRGGWSRSSCAAHAATATRRRSRARSGTRRSASAPSPAAIRIGDASDARPAWSASRSTPTASTSRSTALPVARRGRPLPGALPRAARRMRKREFRVELALGLGRGTGRILAADLTTAYVHFNAAYTT